MTSNIGSEHIAAVGAEGPGSKGTGNREQGAVRRGPSGAGSAGVPPAVAAGLRTGRGRDGASPTAPLDPSAPRPLDPSDVEIELRVKEELKRHFRPEFLNRIDEVVVFHRLTREHLRGIVDRQVALLQQRLAAATGVRHGVTWTGDLAHGAASGPGGTGVSPVSPDGRDARPSPWPVGVGMTLELTDAAKDQLAQDGYDPVYGARPLKRLIQQQIENPLAKRILRGDFGPGDHIVVDAAGETYTFAKRVAAEVSPAGSAGPPR